MPGARNWRMQCREKEEKWWPSGEPCLDGGCDGGRVGRVGSSGSHTAAAACALLVIAGAGECYSCGGCPVVTQAVRSRAAGGTGAEVGARRRGGGDDDDKTDEGEQNRTGQNGRGECPGKRETARPDKTGQDDGGD